MVEVNDEPATIDQRARLRACRERMADAIAQGWNDIVYEPPLTPAEREALGLDLGFFDDDPPTVDRSDPTADHEPVLPRDDRR
jgi:hypothetical protein